MYKIFSRCLWVGPSVLTVVFLSPIKNTFPTAEGEGTQGKEGVNVHKIPCLSDTFPGDRPSQ